MALKILETFGIKFFFELTLKNLRLKFYYEKTFWYKNLSKSSKIIYSITSLVFLPKKDSNSLLICFDGPK